MPSQPLPARALQAGNICPLLWKWKVNDEKFTEHSSAQPSGCRLTVKSTPLSLPRLFLFGTAFDFFDKFYANGRRSPCLRHFLPIQQNILTGHNFSKNFTTYVCYLLVNYKVNLTRNQKPPPEAQGGCVIFIWLLVSFALRWTTAKPREDFEIMPSRNSASATIAIAAASTSSTGSHPAEIWPHGTVSSSFTNGAKFSRLRTSLNGKSSPNRCNNNNSPSSASVNLVRRPGQRRCPSVAGLSESERERMLVARARPVWVS